MQRQPRSWRHGDLPTRVRSLAGDEERGWGVVYSCLAGRSLCRGLARLLSIALDRMTVIATRAVRRSHPPQVSNNPGRRQAAPVSIARGTWIEVGALDLATARRSARTLLFPRRVPHSLVAAAALLLRIAAWSAALQLCQRRLTKDCISRLSRFPAIQTRFATRSRHLPHSRHSFPSICRTESN